MNFRRFLIPFFVSALLTSLLILVVQLRRPSESAADSTRKAGAEAPAAREEVAEDVPDEHVATVPGRVDQPEVPVKPAVNVRQATRSDRTLVDALAKAVQEKDGDAVEKLVQSGVLDEGGAAVLKKWIEDKGVKLRGDKPVEAVGSADGGRMMRYRLYGEDGRNLLVDLVRDAAGAWKVKSVQEEDEKAAADCTRDALTVADSFVKAVRKGDFRAARRLTTGKAVNDATIAGLCMVFEEGDYALRDREPIKVMLENESNAGFLVYLRSAAGKTANMGLELAKGDAGKWAVENVSMDALLDSYAQRGNQEGGFYFPLVKNPKGGDSVALFFGFDEAELTPRSLRQLSIVADLLKESSRHLEISGHTDDLGSDAYNRRLSARRAQAVKAALVKLGVPASQVSTKAMGKIQPRRTYAAGSADEELEAIRGENRRAEIYLDFVEEDA